MQPLQQPFSAKAPIAFSATAPTASATIASAATASSTTASATTASPTATSHSSTILATKHDATGTTTPIASNVFQQFPIQGPQIGPVVCPTLGNDPTHLAFQSDPLDAAIEDKLRIKIARNIFVYSSTLIRKKAA